MPAQQTATSPATLDAFKAKVIELAATNGMTIDETKQALQQVMQTLGSAKVSVQAS